MSQPDDKTQCQDLQLRIEAFVDEELEQTEATSLREHLEICPACARQVRLAAEIRQELRGSTFSTPSWEPCGARSPIVARGSTSFACHSLLGSRSEPRRL
jgi:anti-sigma factor (TIGR02949 family)